MKRTALVLLAGVLACAPLRAEDPTAAALQDAFAQVAQKIKPAVVSVTAVHVENVQVMPPEFFFGDPFEDFFNQFNGRAPQQRPRPAPRQMQRRMEGLGSGVVIDAQGYVLTNEHVVHGAEKLTVTFQFPEEKKYEAKVVGADPRTDLAVLKLVGGKDFPAAELADSDRVRVGDWAIAVGSPFGLEQTVTVGIISAVRQSLNIEGANYADMLQTDAAINRGNSGGPLVNLKGQVVGINTAIYAPTGVFAGIGFSIPSNRAKDIMSQLIQKGKVVRGWMGVEIAPLDDVLAKQFGVKDGKGVVVNAVLPDSPAFQAGMKRGDVIVSFNGKATPDQGALLEVVARTPPSVKVPVGVIRDGKSVTLFLVTGEAPASPEEPGEAPSNPKKGEGRGDQSSVWEGAQLAPASPALAERHGFPPAEKGVVVVSLAPDGLAERVGLMEGDLVASINGVKTPDVKTFLSAAKKADVKQGVVFDVFRRGRWMYLTHQESK